MNLRKCSICGHWKTGFLLATSEVLDDYDGDGLSMVCVDCLRSRWQSLSFEDFLFSQLNQDVVDSAMNKIEIYNSVRDELNHMFWSKQQGFETNDWLPMIEERFHKIIDELDWSDDEIGVIRAIAGLDDNDWHIRRNKNE